MNKIISYGGLGDSWIVFQKLLETYGTEKVDWTHINAHQCHHDSINELQNMYPYLQQPPTTLVIPGGKPSEDFIKQFKHNGGIKVETTATEIQGKIKDWSFLNAENKMAGKYIVVQSYAGRPNDNTRRGFTIGFAEAIRHKTGLEVVMVGGKIESNKGDSVIMNLSGQTSVRELIGIVKNSLFTVAYDGFVAYLAMSFGINTELIWHVPTLPGHYMNKIWKPYTKEYFFPAHEIKKDYADQFATSIMERM